MFKLTIMHSAKAVAPKQLEHPPVRTVKELLLKLAAKAQGPGFDSRRLPGCFLFQQAF